MERFCDGQPVRAGADQGRGAGKDATALCGNDAAPWPGQRRARRADGKIHIRCIASGNRGEGLSRSGVDRFHATAGD
jgi:hypothetical protein